MSVKCEQFIDINIINANCSIRQRGINAVYEGVNGRLAVSRRERRRRHEEDLIIDLASFKPYLFRVENVMFAEVEAYSIDVEGEEPSLAFIAAKVFVLDLDICVTVRSVVLNGGLGVWSF